MATAKAAEQSQRWSIKGFGSFGGAGLDTKRIGFLRNRTQTQAVDNSWGVTTDSRLGVQFDGDMTDSLHATVQWIARDHAGDFFEQNLEWAFVRWQPRDDVNIRIGRLGLDTFLLSDYREVGYAYPWMRPPHEFYANIPVSHFDGIDFAQKFAIDNDFLTLKFQAGYSTSQMQTGLGLFTIKAPTAGVNLVYEVADWRVRAGYSYLHFLSDVPAQDLINTVNDPALASVYSGAAGLSSALSLKDTDLHFMAVGAAYDDGTWLAQAEASYMATDNAYVVDAASAYLSVGRRISEFTVYGLYGLSFSFNDRVDIPAPSLPAPPLLGLQKGLDRALNYNSIAQQSFSLGVRWDFYANIAFKAQWTHFWFCERGAALWAQDEPGNIPDQVNLWSLGVDFVF
ncbi:MAG: hypothetical protein IBX55_06515 [Methyloprofundus sp.]|nr:hypothetical protein [Methyloprofundus sp.]